jgi:predicted ChrR family anti-sigma factor
MTSERRPNGASCADVRLHGPEIVLRFLTDEEQQRVTAHVVHCPPCAEAIADLSARLAPLTRAYREVEPPPTLWDRVAARVAEERARAAEAGEEAARRVLPPGSTLVRASSGGWRETSVPGVRVRILHEDADADRRTALYRMEPGSKYPAHVHGGPEECYVLEGELELGELRMGPGDYQRVDGESRHAVQSTEEGCLLLIVCSMSDRLELE